MGGIKDTTELRVEISGIGSNLQTQMHGCVGSDAGWVGRKAVAPNRHQMKRRQGGSSSSPNQPVVASGGAYSPVGISGG